MVEFFAAPIKPSFRITFAPAVLAPYVTYLIQLNFRAPLVLAWVYAKANRRESKAQISRTKINSAKLKASENQWCAKIKVRKV